MIMVMRIFLLWYFAKKLSSHKFNYVMKVHSNIENKHIVGLCLKDIKSYEIPESGLCDPEDLKKEEENRYNYLGLQKLLTPLREFEFTSSGCFVQQFEIFSNHANSAVFENSAGKLSQNSI